MSTMNEFLKNKKGMSQLIRWTIYFIILGIIITAVMVIVNRALSKKLDTHNLEYSILAARIVNNPLCLAYQDKDTLKVYPGIINLDNYNNESLKECLVSTEEKPLGIKVDLSNHPTLYVERQNYEDFGPLAFSNLYVQVDKKIYVLIQEKNGKKTPALLTISITGKKR